jgi:hypothetical protein
MDETLQNLVEVEAKSRMEEVRSRFRSALGNRLPSERSLPLMLPVLEAEKDV